MCAPSVNKDRAYNAYGMSALKNRKKKEDEEEEFDLGNLFAVDVKNSKKDIK
jgi:hypothetical protein